MLLIITLAALLAIVAAIAAYPDHWTGVGLFLGVSLILTPLSWAVGLGLWHMDRWISPSWLGRDGWEMRLLLLAQPAMAASAVVTLSGLVLRIIKHMKLSRRVRLGGDK